MYYKLHFSPSKGWMNDPNGLIKIGDTYHIFYQHYPDDTVWGPMHWGHATSKDLINWKHLPIAIYPEEELYIFSGSCILDTENVSGLSKDSSPVLIAFYTSHDRNNGRQEQSIAYSQDFVNFIKYEKNPIISNTILPDFRDPKVFKNTILGGYSMVVAAGKYIIFYHSMNLLDWEETGRIRFCDYGYTGIVECPDCFLGANETESKWILSASIVIPEDWDTATPSDPVYNLTPHFTQYFIGSFDGKVFIPDQEIPKTKFLDYGTDNYAGVTFANCENNILMAWGDNWKYVNDAPASISRGKLTLARLLKLCKHNEDYYISSSPVLPAAKTLLCNFQITDFSEKNFYSDRVEIIINYFDAMQVSIENNAGEEFAIEITPCYIIVDRSKADNKTFSDIYNRSEYNIKKVPNLNIGNKLQIIIDSGFFEIFTNNGIINFTMNTYPKYNYNKISIHGNATTQIYKL